VSLVPVDVDEVVRYPYYNWYGYDYDYYDPFGWGWG